MIDITQNPLNKAWITKLNSLSMTDSGSTITDSTGLCAKNNATLTSVNFSKLTQRSTAKMLLKQIATGRQK